MKVRTVIIVSDGAPLVINEADFRYGSDVLWDDYEGQGDAKEEGSAKAEVEEQIEAEEEPENDVVVTHRGGGRWIVTVNGQSVHEGTLTKVDAQALAAEY